MPDTSLTPALLVVLVVAKAIALAGHDLPLTWWSPIALFWHDAATVLAFAIVEHLAGPKGAARHVVRATYAALVLYVALNVPVTRVLSTPLTWTMWRAARGPLADSIVQYATWDHALLMALVIAIGITIARLTPRAAGVLCATATSALVVALGPLGAARVDTRGLERNAWTALATTAMPRADARAPEAHWMTQGFDRTRDDRLQQFRGGAAGRHVILVSLESTGARYLGLYGAAPDVMPNLSALAQHAIVFERAYAVYPESIKGLYSILCSAYPTFDSDAASYADVPCTSIASVLRNRGYRTSLFHSGRFGYLGMDSIIQRRGYDRLADAGDIGGRHDSSFGVDEPSTVARILQWIDAVPRGHRRDRFFVTYLPIAGHHPYETPAPGPFPERDDIDRYRNALHDGDAALGTLVRGIRDRGLEHETLWIVLGDHGEAFGQHDGNYGHTFQIYDENVHVPFLIAAPGVIDTPRRSRQVGSLIDTAPTILDLIGEPIPPAYDGRSMLDGSPRMAFFFTDYSRRLIGVRDGPYKAIHEIDSGRTRLFDLERDPEETTDIARGTAGRAAWYARGLSAR